MSIHWPIIRSLLASPSRVLVVDDRRSYRGIEILVGAMHVAAHLAPRVQTQTLGLLLPTSGAFPIAALAGWILGKTIVPINYLLKPEEMRYVIDDCGCDTVVTAQPMLDYLGAHADECLRASAGGPQGVKNIIRMEDIPFTGFPEPIRPATPDDDDLGVLLYTSGTSGRPKGVMLTHANIATNVRQVRDWAQFTRRDIMLGVLPQFHSFGLTVLTLLPLSHGIRAVYTARFIPQRLVKLIREHRPTIFVAVPSMYGALLSVKDAGPQDFTSLKYAVSGGEPLPDAVASRMLERFGVRLNEGYGLTETAPVTNWCRPHEYRPHSVGRPLDDVIERIVDPHGRELPPGVDGEVQIKGPNVMRGYYHLPAQTAEAFTPDGFFRTGDMGRFDADGHLFITGRIKEMLIIAGENVFPREIEEVLNRHDSIKDSGVIGQMDTLRGEIPVAFVELRDGATFDEQALKAWCRKSLAQYKVPDRIVCLSELPRNPTGKIMRRELKKML